MTTHLEVGRSAVPSPSTPLVRSIHVEGLFGRYSYAIEVPDEGERLLLIHGDNGSGKTTVLRLVWNLLSASNRHGHRTFLAQTPFTLLRVDLSGGETILVQKREGVLGDYEITVSLPDVPDMQSVYEVDADLAVRRSGRELPLEVYEQLVILERRSNLRARDQYYHEQLQQLHNHEPGQARYSEFLAEREINPLLLADDRSLYSDDPELERLRERMHEREAHLPRGGAPRSNDLVARELRVTLRRVTDWFRNLTIGGQNTGSAGANSIYTNVLRELASPAAPRASEIQAPSAIDSVGSFLSQLERDSPRFEEFGLVPHFAAYDFIDLLSQVPDDRQSLAVQIIGPFLDSLRARYKALEEPERKLRTLVTLLNDFLVDKRVTFTPGDGLQILTDDGTSLEPDSLSSGERQLTMLLCTTILASRDSKLFIIDEPELSLGVVWQRKILDALLDLTEGSSLQFMVATHSIEIISGHASSLVRLTRGAHERRGG